MRYSIIIPIYDPEGKNEQMTAQCLNSILRNSSKYEYEIIPIYHKDLNYSTAVNIGFKRATGDYLVICSNDIEINDQKWLEKYSNCDGIASFRQHAFYITQEPIPDASCWGMDRVTFNKVGLLDEQFKDGYGYEDTDYWMRCKESSIPFTNAHVELYHKENQTFQTYFSAEKNEMMKKNKELFLKKWGHKFNA